jgi:hypothetical protein
LALSSKIPIANKGDLDGRLPLFVVVDNSSSLDEKKRLT